MKLRPAVFIDRDGVLNVPIIRGGRSFAPTSMKDFIIYPKTPQNIEKLRAKGFGIVVITNQPDVGNGLIDSSLIDQMHEALRNVALIDDIQVCFDTREQQNNRLKPSPFMILEAAKTLFLDLANSYMVGDRASDIIAGQAAGCGNTIFIDRFYEAEEKPEAPSVTVGSFSDAVDWILDREDSKLIQKSDNC